METVPRKLVKQGLPGLGQNIFPESAREIGRRIWLYPDEVKILHYTSTSDGAGDVDNSWDDPDDVTAVRGRIDPVGRASGVEERGATPVEGSTHRVRFDTGQDVTSKDRIYVQGQVFIILGSHYRTDQLAESVDVRIL
jgi:head-tail adaptor